MAKSTYRHAIATYVKEADGSMRHDGYFLYLDGTLPLAWVALEDLKTLESVGK